MNEPAANDIDGIKYSKDSSIYFIADEDGNEEYLLGRSAADAVAKVGAATGGKAKNSRKRTSSLWYLFRCHK